MDYLSNDNKGLLWGVLQENNLFEGLKDDNFQKIKSVFENVVYNINLNHPQKGLMEKNKITIEELIQKITDEKKRMTEPKIQMVYKAEDLKSERINDFNIKLKQQQEDLYSTANISKPVDIKFNDNNIDDDKPIGDEMDRLISERMASRERELEIPPISSEASTWINNGRDVHDKKKVSFTDNTVVNTNMTHGLSESTNLNYNNTPDRQSHQQQQQPVSIEKIFNILKKKTSDLESKKVANNVQSNVDNIENINEIRHEIHQIKLLQEKIVDLCSQMLQNMSMKS